MDTYGIVALLVIVAAIALSFVAIKFLGDFIERRNPDDSAEIEGTPRDISTYDTADLERRMQAFKGAYKEPLIWKP